MRTIVLLESHFGVKDQRVFIVEDYWGKHYAAQFSDRGFEFLVAPKEIKPENIFSDGMIDTNFFSNCEHSAWVLNELICGDAKIVNRHPISDEIRECDEPDFGGILDNSGHIGQEGK